MCGSCTIDKIYTVHTNVQSTTKSRRSFTDKREIYEGLVCFQTQLSFNTDCSACCIQIVQISSYYSIESGVEARCTIDIHSTNSHLTVGQLLSDFSEWEQSLSGQLSIASVANWEIFV